MNDEELLRSIEKLLELGSGATDDETQNNAIQFVELKKHTLPNRFLFYRNSNKKAIFVFGGLGAGTRETAISISNIEKIDFINADDIKRICPLYGGENAHLFDKASSGGVLILMDYVFKNGLSFILSCDFAEYPIQNEHIHSALKRGYETEIVFVNRDRDVAKAYIWQRENIQGRVMSESAFETQYEESFKITKKILEEFESIHLRYIDLSNRKIHLKM